MKNQPAQLMCISVSLLLRQPTPRAPFAELSRLVTLTLFVTVTLLSWATSSRIVRDGL
jgi:hypothetical protein